MDHVTQIPIDVVGARFIEPQYLPEGKDEYYLRNEQQFDDRNYRRLSAAEIEVLVKNDNSAEDWNDLTVTENFDPGLVKNCQFFGMVRIGDLRPSCLEHHDLRLPVGLYNSRIVACDFGDHVAIHNVRYMAHYIIGNQVILFNIDEMHTTDHAKFGNGIVKEGEPESVRIWLEVWNESGGRAIAPFECMRPADAYLWARYRHDTQLLDRLRQITDETFDRRRGFYGTVGARTVIKHTRIIKDVAVGSDAYIKGANKLKNLTIRSDQDEPAQIGEGCELVNGIIGYGCHIFYGVQAVRFITGTGSNLKYGARIINSYVGDNSTVSCCEILNNLIFPGHEQHHNSSFLIASLVQGQSNIAAGATIGSNHNSRANDGEILAGRGFWPGLCTNFKHNCRFASYTLIAKGNYPYELDVPLPFALLANSPDQTALHIIPAFWFLYNMYAVARNARKYHDRDKRVHDGQRIEFDYLAPDTVEEIFHALERLETWTGQAHLAREGDPARERDGDQLRRLGRELLAQDAEAVNPLDILAEGVENSGRKVRVLKVHRAYHAYREMVVYYGVKTVMHYMEELQLEDLDAVVGQLKGVRCEKWVNMGGQLMRSTDTEALIQAIKTGKLSTWEEIHNEYERLWRAYAHQKAAHAFGSLLAIDRADPDQLAPADWIDWLKRAEAVQRKIAELTHATRAKDYTHPFRRAGFETDQEMEAVLGRIEDNPFIKRIEEETETFSREIRRFCARLETGR